MTEFVFLPDDDTDPAASLAALGAVAGFPSMGILATAGMTDLGIDGSGSTGTPDAAAKVRVVKVAAESGAALVDTVRRTSGTPPSVPGGKLYKVVNYGLAVASVRLGRARLAASAGPLGAQFFTLTIRSSQNGAAVSGAVCTLRLRGSTADISAVSDASGVATFGVRAPALNSAMLLVEPGFAGHWGFLSRKIDLSSGQSIDLDPIDLSGQPDCLRHLVRPGAQNNGAGVVVAVIDSGVGPHPDLPTAIGDPDTSIGHGTHVAGIITRIRSGRAGRCRPWRDHPQLPRVRRPGNRRGPELRGPPGDREGCGGWLPHH